MINDKVVASITVKKWIAEQGINDCRLDVERVEDNFHSILVCGKMADCTENISSKIAGQRGVKILGTRLITSTPSNLSDRWDIDPRNNGSQRAR